MVTTMIDRDGYRPNVAIVLVNHKNEVFWGKRIKEHAWQFPQGGIKPGETPEQAMFRELEEETGLKPDHVEILGRTKGWLHYNVPMHWINCLLYTSDAADDLLCVDLGGRRII